MVMESGDPGPGRSTADDGLNEIGDRVEALGLRLRGGFALDPARDMVVLERFAGARSLVMIGNAGDELWRRSGPAIRARKGAHPLNDWIVENLTPLATLAGAGILFDFEGPPYWPFQQWARRAEPVHGSPLGILIHPQFGLWHAYRAAFVFDRRLALPGRREAPSPCDSCADKPCLVTCPVGAFGDSGYDVGACADHVLGRGRECRDLGCLARLACPVGGKYRYTGEQAGFHMASFVASLRRRQGVG